MATHSVILAWRVPLDKGAWWSAVHRVTESDTTEATSHTPAGRGHKPRRAGGFLKPEEEKRDSSLDFQGVTCPVDILIPAHEDPCGTSNLQNWKIINSCLFSD